ncbi:MAG TPA: TonB-dependent receptor [Rhizomicrobium sp.]
MQVKWFTTVALAALLAGPCAYADTPAPSGILTYAPEFFADSRPNTAFDMVKRLPGFTLNDGATARGFAGTAGNVLINGQRPTTKSDSLDSILQRTPAKNVDHIELIRGGAPGIDMQGQTVVANIVLKSADSTTIVATAEDLIFTDGHMVPYGALEFTQHSGASTYEGSASVLQNYDDSVGGGYHNVYDGAGNLLTHDQTSSHGLGLGLALKGAATVPLFSGEFKANLTLQVSPFISRLSYQRPGFIENFLDKSRAKGAELGLHWKGNIGNAQLETLLLQHNRHENDIDDADDTITLQHFTASQDTSETIGRATLRYLPLPELTLEGGGEFAYNRLDGHTAFAVNGANIPLPSADAQVQEKRSEVFAQGTWKFAPEWLLEAGARLEFSTIGETGTVNQTRSFFYPKPRAVLTWAPSADTQVRLRYEKVVGQLDFNNFIATANLSSTGVTAGNADLKPDQRSQFEVSFEQHFWDKGAFVLTLMHEEIADVVDLVPVTDSLGNIFDAPGNIGGGRNDEINLAFTLPFDKLGIEGGLLTTSAIWDISSVRDPVTGVKRVISGQRPNNINIKFSQDVASLQSTWGVFYYNAWDEYYYRLTQVRHRFIPPPYGGVFWDWKPSPDWSLHVETDNVFAFTYHDKKFNYAGPRNISALTNIDEYVGQSRPTIDIQIRHTF